mgnify:CR=1 FL=1
MMVVTGATGHIGNVLVRELLKKGHKVRCIVLPQESIGPLAGLDVELARADVLDYPALRDAVRGAEGLFHLAGIVTIVSGQRQKLQAVNVLGTRNVIRASRECKVGRLIYTSSVHALVEPPFGTTIAENAGFDPRLVHGDYGKSKAQASLEVLEAAKEDLDAVVAIPAGVIGPYDYKPSEMGQLIVDYLNGKMRAFLDGAYNFVDVRDVAKGLIAAFERGARGESYLLSGYEITIEELFRTLSAFSTVSMPQLKLPTWLCKVASFLAVPYYKFSRITPRFTPYSMYVLGSNCTMSFAKAKRELGFLPRPPVETLQDTVAWFRQEGLFL